MALIDVKCFEDNNGNPQKVNSDRNVIMINITLLPRLRVNYYINMDEVWFQ